MSEKVLALTKKHGYTYVNSIKDKKVWVVSQVVNRKRKYFVMKQSDNQEEFRREVRLGKLLSADSIAPAVIFSDRKDLIIVTPKLTPLADEDGEVIDVDVITPEFVNALEGKISLMHHKYEIGHGDLNLNNIVYDKQTSEPYIIDFEKAYAIHNHTWETEDWMRKGYSWEESYANFVNSDYTSWKLSTNLDVADSPRDHIPIQEEYYVQRFSLGNSNAYLSGDCGSLAVALKDKLGGLVYGVYSEDLEWSVPMHYVLKLNNGLFVDSTGVYTNDKSLYRVMFSMFEAEIPDLSPIAILVDQETLNNSDYECDITPKIRQDVETIVKILNI